MMKRLVVSILILFLFLGRLQASSGTVLQVRSQADFDRLPHDLVQAVKPGRGPVTVSFRKGTYRFRQNHLLLENLNCPGVELSVQCNGSFFLSEGPDYTVKGALGRKATPFNGPFDYRQGFVDLTRMKSIDARTGVREVLSAPEILDPASGSCRVRVKEKDLPSDAAQGVYMILSQWYRGIVYPVDRIENGYLYFHSPKVTLDGNALTDPRADSLYAGVKARYILYNHPGSGLDFYVSAGRIHTSKPMRIHQSLSSNFLRIAHCRFASFSLEGAHFLANEASGCLLEFSDVSSTGLTVRDCTFDGIRSDILHLEECVNFLFCDNVITRSYRRGLVIDGFSAGVEIRGNRFSDTGWMMNNDFCIDARAGSMWIHHNTFVDFSYGAIGIGTYYRSKTPPSSSGWIEQNEMYCTPAFLSHPARLLMDSGALYTWTVNKNIVLRDNVIHDIGGYKDNRGIFCDDGTVNVAIVGNKVTGIRNSYCIDLRYVPSVETHPDSQVRRASRGNRMEGNVVDGPVRFENQD